jgi:AbrB family looped-hinge helix DNA binding protein
MRITETGQITIPIDIRQRLGFLPDTEVEFTVRGNEMIIRKQSGQRERGRRLISALRGQAKRTMSTDQIMALMRGR